MTLSVGSTECEPERRAAAHWHCTFWWANALRATIYVGHKCQQGQGPSGWVDQHGRFGQVRQGHAAHTPHTCTSKDIQASSSLGFSVFKTCGTIVHKTVPPWFLVCMLLVSFQCCTSKKPYMQPHTNMKLNPISSNHSGFCVQAGLRCLQ